MIPFYSQARSVLFCIIGHIYSGASFGSIEWLEKRMVVLLCPLDRGFKFF